MSRCFPFPPPGYEKKDDVDLLTKEKHKEKKHKKEKENKREGKEKDKERSKDKHKEKKDRDKDKKHRDKKDKDSDKDKNKNSDDKSKNLGKKRFEGISEGCNGGKPSENSQRFAEIKDSKPVENLGSGIFDEERTKPQMAETIIGAKQRRTEGMGRVVEKDFDKRGEGDKKSDVQKANWQRKRFGEGFVGGTMVKNITRVDQKSFEKDSNNDKKSDDRNAGGQTNRKGGTTASAIDHNFTGVDQKRVEGMARLMDKDAEKGEEKNKSKASDDKHGNKHKKREKKSKGKDKDGYKKKEREEKEKGDLKNNKQDNLTDSGMVGIDTLSIKTPQISKDITNGAATEGNIRKRKDLESNGFLHETEIRPNKLLKPAFSSHLFTENGRKLQPCQTATQCASDRQGASNNLKADDKELTNGIIEAHTSSVNSAKSSIASLHISENGGAASTKPPHPDTKYLSQILSVPKMEEISDFDDQEWLFNSDDVQSKKPKDGSSGDEGRPQVWAEAVRIDSYDIYALPFVILY